MPSVSATEVDREAEEDEEEALTIIEDEVLRGNLGATTFGVIVGEEITEDVLIGYDNAAFVVVAGDETLSEEPKTVSSPRVNAMAR